MLKVTIHKITEDQMTDEMKRAWNSLVRHVCADDPNYEEAPLDDGLIPRTMPKVKQIEEHVGEIIEGKRTKRNRK